MTMEEPLMEKVAESLTCLMRVTAMMPTIRTTRERRNKGRNRSEERAARAYAPQPRAKDENAMRERCSVAAESGMLREIAVRGKQMDHGLVKSPYESLRSLWHRSLSHQVGHLLHFDSFRPALVSLPEVSAYFAAANEESERWTPSLETERA